MATTQTSTKEICHLMRRAGFGVNYKKLPQLTAKTYEEIVDDLINFECEPRFDDHIIRRYFLELNNSDTVNAWRGEWIYRMVNSKRPLEEKMALFWHHLFATSVGKSEHGPSSVIQIETFRRLALAKFEDILIAVARDPAMLFWLDNNENHLGEPNENWGRELLELFSMGVGNYTEDDIKQASRAFTGWTFTQPLPLDPYGRYSSDFYYNSDDHDNESKSFLGHTGNLDGEDIIQIIVKQSATATFIARHLYNFFVADEPQVPAWNITPAKDQDAIDFLVECFLTHEGNMREVMRQLFLSDFFRSSVSTRVKSPAELVAGVVVTAGTHDFPNSSLPSLGSAAANMGQNLMTPPTVEGWHYGSEWIDGGTLNNRVNFAAAHISQAISNGVFPLEELVDEGTQFTTKDLVDQCLYYLGLTEISDDTRHELLVSSDDILETKQDFKEKIISIARLIVSTIDYQFA
ncbi:MAG: DUF1800 family protein [Dehalococcoidia bacterium]